MTTGYCRTGARNVVKYTAAVFTIHWINKNTKEHKCSKKFSRELFMIRVLLTEDRPWRWRAAGEMFMCVFVAVDKLYRLGLWLGEFDLMVDILNARILFYLIPVDHPHQESSSTASESARAFPFYLRSTPGAMPRWLFYDVFFTSSPLSISTTKRKYFNLFLLFAFLFTGCHPEQISCTRLFGLVGRRDSA